ncbi:ABC superfamily ATP binding cassette transporter permease protein [Levilactobacillus paucivorans]|uniref:ABC superfamily ATP binding cassette transporter permease protein n=1 Tax=Levilactobacillus paucivorans TaxID=616990 RepID=A0A0R2LUD6_9LACO|nr:ABC transporter permease subunit [Levilactobacillus paucivorans]KRO04790.1 ABC superfamily ATP binding cassette transporter permease protein [Levilactobacillus paucivorans]
MSPKASTRVARGIIAFLFVYLATPIVVTMIYSFSTSWVKTILPNGLTLKWYSELVASPEFMAVLLRSFCLGLLTTLIAMACFLPVVFYANVYNPKVKSHLRFITVLPFTIPGIILVTGLIQLYAELPIPKIIILVLAISLLSLPLTYQALDNAFIGRDFRAMFEQALVLGDSPFKAFVKVIIPNIRAGVLVAMLLTFTSAFGEYVLTNLLLGGNFETLKIYMYRLMRSNGQASSVLTTIYFIFLAFISLILILIMQHYSAPHKSTKEGAKK